MSDNMPGVKSVRYWSLELTEIILGGEGVQLLMDSKVTEIINAGRSQGMTEAALIAHPTPGQQQSAKAVIKL